MASSFTHSWLPVFPEASFLLLMVVMVTYPALWTVIFFRMVGNFPLSEVCFLLRFGHIITEALIIEHFFSVERTRNREIVKEKFKRILITQLLHHECNRSSNKLVSKLSLKPEKKNNVTFYFISTAIQ